MLIIDPKKLESLLVAKWTDFVQIRTVIEFCKQQAASHGITSPIKISDVTVTRLDVQDEGFVLWIEYKATSKNLVVKLTSESLLSFDGLLKSARTIEEFRQHRDA